MKKQLGIMVAALLTMLGLAGHADAAGINFSVETQQSKYQLDKAQTYYDLQATPGRKMTVKAKLTNRTADQIDVNIAPRAAETNSLGNVTYGDGKSGNKAPFNVANIVDTPAKVTLPGHGSKTIKMVIMVPDKEYDGVVAGAISFAEDAQGQSTASTQMENQYAYVVGLMLHEGDAVTTAPVTFGDKWQAVAGECQLTVTNPVGMFLNRLQVKHVITDQAGKVVKRLTAVENGQMAPFSTMKLNLSAAEQGLADGQYQVKTTVSSKGQSWSTDKTITIAAKSASTTATKTGLTAIEIGLIILVIFLIAGAVWLYIIRMTNVKKMDRM